MKRSVFLTVLLLCLFCGCSRRDAVSAQPPQLEPVQERTVFIRTPLAEMTATWHFDMESDFTVQEPASLRGLKINCSVDECTASLGESVVPFPQSAAFSQIDKAFRTLLHGTVIPNQTQDGWKYDGSLYGFTAMQEPTDGKLLSMDFPRIEITVSFEP